MENELLDQKEGPEGESNYWWIMAIPFAASIISVLINSIVFNGNKFWEMLYIVELISLVSCLLYFKLNKDV